ncbi:MAG TPA: VacJ family lipoprotein [Rhizomicrobium sp.]|nr:VacJ family lipoprotein [Rhizomicrobium sp.]
MNRLRALILFLLGPAVAACTAVDEWSATDPLEGFNRQMFRINQSLDRHAALPAAVFYKSSVPEDFREGFHNVLSNVGMPITFANDVLQGQFRRAGIAAQRFGVNTTVGILGVNDPATKWGLPQQTEDFGQTLGVYGVPAGPYVVLPLIGSALPRDAVGKIYVDHFFSPLSYFDYSGRYYVSLGARVLATVDGRARAIDDLRDIERNSVDYYSAMRDIYIKRRQDQVDNKAPSDSLDPLEN